jgi:hypothetical protein
MILNNIFIKLNDCTITYNHVNQRTTIEELVEKIINDRNIDEKYKDYIRLGFGGKILENKKTLEDYSINNESTILFWYSSSKNRIDISNDA